MTPLGNCSITVSVDEQFSAGSCYRIADISNETSDALHLYKQACMEWSCVTSDVTTVPVRCHGTARAPWPLRIVTSEMC